MENINKLEIVPDEVYEIGADKAPVIPEWSVKDDTTLLQKVKDLAHSTFDRSKFTIIGSPVITKDGIASGFSSSNYLIKSAFIPLTFNKLVIKCEFKTSIVTAYDGIFSLYTASQAQKINLIFNYNKISLSSGNTIFATLTSTSNWVANTEYSVNVEIDTTLNKIFVDIYNPDGTAFYSNSTSFTTALDTTKTFSLLLGIQSGASYPLTNGSIDLKQFSITVDGVELFSGNKTGVDTIKSDDYTVVGSPTISADGIASGFSISNYITKTITDLDYSKDFDFISPVATLASNSSQKFFVLDGGTGGGGFRISQHVAQVKFSFKLNTDTTLTDYFILSGLVVGDKIQGRIKKVGTDLYLYARKNDGEWVGYANNPITNVTTLNATNFINIGWTGAGDRYCWDGSIDLNAFKIYVDGNLVYQPCLKIPYTEGQNYVKVVDKLYRDRVKDLFEQKGYNGYYTIGEDDFTLPSNKWSDVIEHKENGLTVAEQRVDQTLTIRGACEQGADVNLPMEFFSADSYAVFGVGTTGTNTASKFTPAADGNYIAIGKGKV